MAKLDGFFDMRSQKERESSICCDICGMRLGNIDEGRIGESNAHSYTFEPVFHMVMDGENINLCRYHHQEILKMLKRKREEAPTTTYCPHCGFTWGFS